jgi:hypothetical protein
LLFSDLPDGKPWWYRGLTPCEFNLIAKSAERLAQNVAVVALNFNNTVFNGTARPATLFKRLCQRF